MGDETLSSFPSAVDAVNCALAIQAALRKEPELRVRIGIHVGDVVHRDGSLHGDGVNIASRIRPLAEPGGICVSDEIQHSIQNQDNLETRSLGDHEFKNVPRTVAVFTVAGTAAPPAPLTTPRPQRQRVVRATPALAALAAIGAVLVAGLSWWALNRPITSAGLIRSIAVLPLENLSDDPEHAYFADGLTDALIGDLAKLGELRVISRTSVMRYKNANKSMSEIAEELQVDGVIEGTVIREGDRVRVTVQLIDARQDAHLWAERYDRNLAGMLALQGELARTIAQQVRIELTAEERATLTTSTSVAPRAYDAYVRGLELYGSVHSLLEAVREFERAVELDPDFAEAYAQLGSARLLVAAGFLRPPEERRGMMPAAVEAAARALELDDRLGAAHATIGAVRLLQWDFAAADRSLERAVKLSPSDPRVLGSYLLYLVMMTRLDEARSVAERLRVVAPFDHVHRATVARTFFYTRDYQRSVEEHQRALELDPAADIFHLSFAYAQLGRENEAHEWQLATNRRYERAGLPGRARMTEAQERGWNESGLEGSLRTVLEVYLELAAQGLFSPLSVAITYARLGETNESFAWLERAYDAHEAPLFSLKAQPLVDPLRSDPRFQDLLRRIGFPEE